MRISQLKQQAGNILGRDPDFRKLVVLHSLISAGVSVLLMVISWLSSYLAPDGSLSTMDTLVLMDTIQATLQLFSILAVPFWDAGLIFCALRSIRGRKHGFSSLAEGFFRWFPFLGAGLVLSFIYFLVSTACSTVTGILLSFLPLPPSVYEGVLVFMENPTFPLEGGVLVYALAYFGMYLLSLCVILIPNWYLHRLVSYRIMDDEPCGGLKAVLQSRLGMRGNRRRLFLLDLSYWWFYLLEALIMALSVGDLFLAQLGITLPWLSTEAAGWIFPLMSLAAQVLLHWLAKPRMSLSYALFYQSTGDPQEPTATKPRRMPWKY